MHDVRDPQPTHVTYQDRDTVSEERKGLGPAILEVGRVINKDGRRRRMNFPFTRPAQAAKQACCKGVVGKQSNG